MVETGNDVLVQFALFQLQYPTLIIIITLTLPIYILTSMHIR